MAPRLLATDGHKRAFSLGLQYSFKFDLWLGPWCQEYDLPPQLIWFVFPYIIYDLWFMALNQQTLQIKVNILHTYSLEMESTEFGRV